MDHHREKPSTSFARIVHDLGRKQHPAIDRSPAPQTSLIFELPDELILSILSHVPPDPRLADQYARFRVLCSQETDHHHQPRAEFLRPLSMTCRAMRLRLLPWVWERLELPPPRNVRGETYERKLGPIAKTFHANVFLAASVKFMTVNLPLDGSALRSFVKCLKSLPNLHTLEIKCSESSCHTTPLRKALKGVQFPQIKTLILPLTAHPLLRHCCDVEDVVHAVEHGDISPDEFFGSLASMRDSKVERLTIPAASLDNQLSRFLVMCPMLTELTIVCPPSLEARATAFKAMTGAFRSAYSAISKLITVCSALSDFDTLQIVYFLVLQRYKVWGCGELWRLHEPSIKQDQASREHMECVRDRAVGQCAHDWLLEYTKGLAIERWKKRETRCQEG